MLATSDTILFMTESRQAEAGARVHQCALGDVHSSSEAKK